MTSTHRYQPPPQNSQNDFRLPSLKDLNFAYRPPTGPQDSGIVQQQEHTPTTRHPPAWARSTQPPAPSAAQPPHQQHTPPLSAGHEMPPKVDYPSKHENGGYAHPGIPLSAQAAPVPGSVNIGPQRGEDTSRSPAQPKRQRKASTNMPASRDVRTSHSAAPQYAGYPPTSQTQPASHYHQVPSGLPGPPTHAAQAAPAPHPQAHHPPMPVTAHPGYTYTYVHPRQTLLHPQQSSQPTNPYPSPGPPPPAAPPPQTSWAQPEQQQQQQQHLQQALPPQQHVQSHHHQQPQPSIPPNSAHSIPHHQQQQAPQPPPPTQHPQQIQQPVQQQQQLQYAPPYQPPQQQQAQSFGRTTAIVPTTLEPRQTYNVPPPEPERVPSVQNDAMSEITNQCNILCNFANRYATLQQTMPHAQPSPAELEEMSQRALTVVRLLEEFRGMNIFEAPAQPVQTPVSVQQDTPEESRPPKRPWEDVSQEDSAAPPEANGFQDQFSVNPPPAADTKPQTTAEQDMELIRTKRATSTAVASGSAGQPKSKYRKRSRASPPGKCHSCNIRETPEWRRGPDGARTLCNACGLHYAKLMRKQNKAGGNGEVVPIDLETLRASARAADIAEKARSSSSNKSGSSRSNQQQQQSAEPTSPMDTSTGGGGGASTTTTNTNTGKQGGVPPPTTAAATHQGSFQVVNLMTSSTSDHQSQSQSQAQGQAQPSSAAMQVDSRPPSQPHMPHQQQQQQQQQAMPPPPPWPTTAVAGPPVRAAYGGPFMRAQQPSR